MNFQRLLKELKDLDLPSGEYVVVGSGALGARSIRGSKDFDILVSNSLWLQLSQRYPVVSEYSVEKIKLGNLEILGNGSIYRDGGIASVEEQIKTADIIKSLPFLRLDLLRKFKQKIGREKDMKDIELIDKYLSTLS